MCGSNDNGMSYSDACRLLQEAQNELTAAQADIERLEQHLLNYGVHAPACDCREGAQYACDCGWAELYKALKGKT